MWRLVEIIGRADASRTKLAAAHPGIDMVIQRGWYSSTDCWSPTLFDEFLVEESKVNAAIAHDCGINRLRHDDGSRGAWRFVGGSLGSRMTIVGANSLSLVTGNQHRIYEEVKTAIEALFPTKRFIPHPVDAIFPDTPQDGIKRLVEAWRKLR